MTGQHRALSHHSCPLSSSTSRNPGTSPARHERRTCHWPASKRTGTKLLHFTAALFSSQTLNRSWHTCQYCTTYPILNKYLYSICWYRGYHSYNTPQYLHIIGDPRRTTQRLIHCSIGLFYRLLHFHFLRQGSTNLYLWNVSSVQQQCIAIIERTWGCWLQHLVWFSKYKVQFLFQKGISFGLTS
jgi:hypothetical protein